MAYIGPPPSQKLATPTSQYFSGNGSATAFTLNRPVNVAEDLNVFVNNVAQQPGSGKSYTATGTTLTFDAAPSSGTNNVYVVYRGLAEPTTRLEHDANAALAATTGTFSGNVGVGAASDTGENHLQFTNNAVTAFVGVEGSSGNRFLGSATNNAFFGTTGADGLELATNNNVRMLIDSSGRVTTPAQPSFHAYGSTASWTIFSNGAWTKLVLNATPPVNVGSHYDTTNSKFVAPVAGVYYFYYKVYGRIQSGGASSTYWHARFQKNNNAITGYDAIIMAYQYNSGGVDEVGTDSMIISLAATDEITVHAIAVGAQNGEYYSALCAFGGHLVG